ncbi:MAG: amidohydrolase [Chloroflexi bacterium]|nr:amidohydrolase [Chloroflexota bacterium]
MLDLLIRGGLILTMDAGGRIILEGSLAVDKGKIVDLGEGLSQPAKRVIDARGKVVLPGLVDAHMHETLTRGVCEDLPLMRWLAEICFPLDRAYTAEAMHAAALLNQLEMIKGGITTFIDIYRFPEEAAKVAEKSGLRAIFSPQIIEHPTGVGESLDSSMEFVQRWKGKGRLQAWFGPHALYSCSPEMYQEIKRLSTEYGVGIHTHLAETREEVETMYRQHGVSPVRLLDDSGVLGPSLLAAHCVHLSEEDIAILQARDVAVAYNPTSNMKLAAGIAPIPQLLRAGVRVGLGTDSNLSNNNLDMFEEMRLGAILQKLQEKDAALLPCTKMLEMGTIGAARCLGLAEEVGSLEVGKKADIIIVDLRKPHLWPLLLDRPSNIVEHLVYSANAGDVDTTIVDGQVLMESRQVMTLNEEEVFATVQAATARLIRRAGLQS